jgi:hypothetical protein
MVSSNNRTNKTSYRIKDRHKDKSFDFLLTHIQTQMMKRLNCPAEDSVETVFRKKEEVVITE